jgi:hypothetical protein
MRLRKKKAYNRGFPVNPAISPFRCFPLLSIKASTFSVTPGGRIRGEGTITSNVFRGRPITRPTDSSSTPEKVTAWPVESRGSADKDERVDEIGDVEPG